MFKMNLNNVNIEKEFEMNDSFRYFKPDLDLKRLRLQAEAKSETRLFYEIQNN